MAAVKKVGQKNDEVGLLVEYLFCGCMECFRIILRRNILCKARNIKVPVTAWSLTGQKFSQFVRQISSLTGHVWLVNFFYNKMRIRSGFFFLPENVGNCSGSRDLYRVRKRLLAFHSGKGGSLAPQNPANIAPSPLRYVLHTAINRADFVSWCMLYTRTKVTKCIREKMTMCFRQWTIKSHSSRHEIGPINRGV